MEAEPGRSGQLSARDWSREPVRDDAADWDWSREPVRDDAADWDWSREPVRDDAADWDWSAVRSEDDRKRSRVRGGRTARGLEGIYRSSLDA
eukprot:1181693-Prorocentrum_minimum.AAC.2